jgi:CBS domain containing-hemolysin-like protein
MTYVEIALIVILILLNGILAMAELAIVSSRRARLRSMVDQLQTNRPLQCRCHSRAIPISDRADLPEVAYASYVRADAAS